MEALFEMLLSLIGVITNFMARVNDDEDFRSLQMDFHFLLALLLKTFVL